MAEDGTSFGVGYGRPPVAHRFRPGQSGNPRGRPRGKQGIATAIDALMQHKVSVTLNGRKRKVSVSEAMLMRVREKALGGDMKAISMLLALLASHGTAADIQRVDTDQLSAEDRAILAPYLSVPGDGDV